MVPPSAGDRTWTDRPKLRRVFKNADRVSHNVDANAMVELVAFGLH
jgi:hypothetical protein